MKSSMRFHFSILLIIGLLVSIGLIGCKQSTLSANAKKYDYFVFPKTDWGMTIEQVKKVYPLKETDAKDETEDDMKTFQARVDIWGKTNDVIFMFQSNGYEPDAKLRLVSVKVKGTTSDFAVLSNSVEKTVKKQGVAYIDSRKSNDLDAKKLIRFTSTKKICDLDKALKDKITEFYKNAPVKYEIEADKNELSMVQLSYNKESKEFQVSFTSHVAEIMGYIIR